MTVRTQCVLNHAKFHAAIVGISQTLCHERAIRVKFELTKALIGPFSRAKFHVANFAILCTFWPKSHQKHEKYRNQRTFIYALDNIILACQTLRRTLLSPLSRAKFDVDKSVFGSSNYCCQSLVLSIASLQRV